MRKLLWAVIAVIGAVVVSAGLLLWSYRPDYNETLTVKGLSAPVTVKRNAFAVPIIEAQDLEDLYFAWGYVNAQDRLFQIEMTRRIGQGRLSEILGPEAIEKDIFLRGVGFAELARKEAAGMKPENRRLLERYAAGVNAYAALHRKPLYMTLLGMEPETWGAADPILVGMMLNWTLAYNMNQEIMYQRLAARLGREKAAGFFNLIPDEAPAILGRIGRRAEARLAALSKDFGDLFGGRSASNSWVLAPERTAVQGPILANDPQVHGSKIPSDFYLISGRAGDLRLTGGQAVGLPFIAFGYNNHAAWGVTNQGADMIDLYLETIDWDRKTYRWGDRDLPLTQKRVTIRVKGADPVEKILYYAGRRPVLSDVLSDLGRDVSLDWAGFHGLGSDGFFELNRARDFEAWESAAKKIRMSPQNVVYADRSGRIAYRTLGVLVRRRAGTGRFPTEAAEGAATWSGVLDPDLYPAAVDPPRGYIVTANNKIVENFLVDMNETVAPQYRYEAIVRMLDGKTDIDADYAAQMQTDIRSKLAPLLAEWMTRLVEPATEIRRDLLKTVTDWDGSARVDSVAPAVLHTWLLRFMILTFQDEFGRELAETFAADRYVSLDRFLDMLERGSAYFDVKGTPEKETAADVAGLALDRTAEMLAGYYENEDPGSWTWGRAHFLRFEHMLGKSRILRPLVNLDPVPFPGDGETNLRAHFYETAPPYTASLASGLRLIVSFDPDPAGRMVLITGQNEYFLSGHYADLTRLWLSGGYMDMENPEIVYEARLNP